MLRAPRPERAAGGNEERPARIENRGTCQEEQPQVELQPERLSRRLEEASTACLALNNARFHRPPQIVFIFIQVSDP